MHNSYSQHTRSTVRTLMTNLAAHTSVFEESSWTDTYVLYSNGTQKLDWCACTMKGHAHAVLYIV